MADIKLNDLNPAGFDLDNEGYLNDLSEDELSVWGGTEGGGCGCGGSLINADVDIQNVLNHNTILADVL